MVQESKVLDCSSDFNTYWHIPLGQNLALGFSFFIFKMDLMIHELPYSMFVTGNM